MPHSVHVGGLINTIRTGAATYGQELLYMDRSSHIWTGAAICGRKLPYMDRSCHLLIGCAISGQELPYLDRSCYIWTGAAIHGRELPYNDRSCYIWTLKSPYIAMFKNFNAALLLMIYFPFYSFSPRDAISLLTFKTRLVTSTGLNHPHSLNIP